MSDQDSAPKAPRRLGLSVLAIVAGFIAVIILSFGTDAILRALKLYNDRMSDPLFMVAAVYRTIYGIIGSYITARVAPYAPMAHALTGGIIGFVLSILGTVVSWSHPEMGPHWYPVALVITALPSAWIGGRIRHRQISR
jgi:hypothetical protein